MAEVNLGSGNNLVMKTSQLVTCREVLTLVISGGNPIDLDIQVQADFGTIPEQYHEVFFNMLTSRYCRTTSFGDNPFSKCVPSKKKSWYQFWK